MRLTEKRGSEVAHACRGPGPPEGEANDVGSGVTAATIVGLAGVAFMFALAVGAMERTGSRGAGAFAAWSATAGLRLLADMAVTLLPGWWSTVAGVVGNVTTWIAVLLLLLFALRFSADPSAEERWRAGPFWMAGLLTSGIVVTNPVHGWYLRSPWSAVTVDFAPLGQVMAAIGLVVVLAVIALLAVAMIRNARRRFPLALVIVGLAVNLGATVLPLFAWSPFGFGEVDVVLRATAAGLFAVALFGFGLLRLVPVGREDVLQRMDDGWLVLDPAGRIADLNPAAERMFRVDARRAIGQRASDALRGAAGLETVWNGDATDRHGTEVQVTMGALERYLDVHVTPLLDRHGTLAGRTLLVRDVSALRRAEASALDRERALAALHERERVARELHDGLAQVLSFVRLQAEAARGLVRRDAATAEAYLDRLAAIALEAHGEVRSFIAGSAAGSQVDWLPAIADAARRVGEDAGLGVELRVDPTVTNAALAGPVAAHLVRIVQEALHNVRKHALARRVTVSVDGDAAHVQVEVADDGVGFAGARGPGDRAGFGLRFMHERAADAGGSLAVSSRPNEGTRVTIRVPRRSTSTLSDGPVAEAIAPGGGGDRRAGADRR